MQNLLAHTLGIRMGGGLRVFRREKMTGQTLFLEKKMTGQKLFRRKKVTGLTLFMRKKMTGLGLFLRKICIILEKIYIKYTSVLLFESNMKWGAKTFS